MILVSPKTGKQIKYDPHTVILNDTDESEPPSPEPYDINKFSPLTDYEVDAEFELHNLSGVDEEKPGPSLQNSHTISHCSKEVREPKYVDSFFAHWNLPSPTFDGEKKVEFNEHLMHGAHPQGKDDSSNQASTSLNWDLPSPAIEVESSSFSEHTLNLNSDLPGLTGPNFNLMLLGILSLQEF